MNEAIKQSAGVEVIPLTAIVESPTNTRRHWGNLDDLAGSIKSVGLLQPVVVRPLLAEGRYELVAGARRFRACQIAGVESIDARVRELTDDQVLEAQAIENDQREDVHPLDQAAWYQALIDRGYDVARLAGRTGRSESYVRQRLQLLALTEEWQKMFLEDRLQLGHALLICRLPPKMQQGLLKSYEFQWIRCEHYLTPTVEKTRALIQGHFVRLDRALWSLDDAELLKAAGACLDCPKRTGSDPALFADLAEDDTCTDQACWAKKQNAWLKRQAECLVADGEPFVRITQDWSRPRGKANQDVLTTCEYECELTDSEATKDRTGRVRRALVVDGRDIGKVVHVRLKADAVPGATESAEAESRQQQEQQARERDRQRYLFNRCLARVFAAIVDKAKRDPDVAPTQEAWRDMATWFWDCTMDVCSMDEDADDALRTIASLFGLTAPAEITGQWQPIKTLTLTDTEWLQLLVLLNAAQRVFDWQLTNGADVKELQEVAGIYGVDGAGIVKAVKAEIRDEQRAAKAAERKAAKEQPDPAGKPKAKRAKKATAGKGGDA